MADGREVRVWSSEESLLTVLVVMLSALNWSPVLIDFCCLRRSVSVGMTHTTGLKSVAGVEGAARALQAEASDFSDTNLTMLLLKVAAMLVD